VLAGDARTRSASREVVDERVDDLGVLAFAHVNTMTRQVVQTTRQQFNRPASQGKHPGQLSLSGRSGRRSQGPRSNKSACLGRDRTIVPL
jgi:hypothetical protein